MFFDLKGKIHLVNIELIQKFSIPILPQQDYHQIDRYKGYRFGFGNNLPECTKEMEVEGQAVQPTRMIKRGRGFMIRLGA